jgi:hypothetical protein
MSLLWSLLCCCPRPSGLPKAGNSFLNLLHINPMLGGYQVLSEQPTSIKLGACRLWKPSMSHALPDHLISRPLHRLCLCSTTAPRQYLKHKTPHFVPILGSINVSRMLILESRSSIYLVQAENVSQRAANATYPRIGHNYETLLPLSCLTGLVHLNQKLLTFYGCQKFSRLASTG